MQALVKQQGMEKEIFCDSAGTLDYHRGKPADARMQKHARLRGYELNSISRPFEYDDFELFDCGYSVLRGVLSVSARGFYELDYEFLME